MSSEDLLPARLYEKMDALYERVEADLKDTSEAITHYCREIQQAHAEISDVMVRLRESAPDIVPAMQALSYAKAMLCLLEMRLTSFLPGIAPHAKRGAKTRAKFRKTGQETSDKRRGASAPNKAYWNEVAQKILASRTSGKRMSGRELARRVHTYCEKHKPEALSSIETIRKNIPTPR